MVHKEHPNVMLQKSVLQVMRSRAGEGCVFGLMTLLWWDVHGLSLAEGPGGCWGGADPRMSPVSHCHSQPAAPGSTKGLGRAGWEHMCSGLLLAPKEEPGERGNQPCSPVCKGFRKTLRTYYSRKQSAYTSTDLVFNSRAFNQVDERYFQTGWTCPA